MNVCFVLPGIGKEINGGYKVVYQYANLLADDGFNVQILYYNDILFNKYYIPKIIKRGYCNYLMKKEPRWFDLNKRINKISSYDKYYRDKIQNTNVAIATAAETVNFVKKEFSNSSKLYFIQGYEKWAMSLQDLEKTYKEKDFTNIVISKSLKKIVDRFSTTPSVYIRNAIDVNKYKVNTPIETRNRYVLGTLYNPNPEKGFKYTFDVIKKVKKLYPSLKVIAFGVPKRPNFFPSWIEYHSCASMDETIQIYNSISIFISTSVNEGFGLTGLESIACGAALVASEYQGVTEYAVNNKNALLSPIKETEQLEKNILKLLKDDKLRIKLARNGSVTAKNYSWQNSYKKFKKIILCKKELGKIENDK